MIMSNEAMTGNRLAGKVAIITGAASGIGLAAARRFIQEGAQVAVVDLNKSGVAQTLEELGADHALGFVADVTQEESIVQLVTTTVERFGKVDIYYNNAGIPMAATPVEHVELTTWQRIMEVNTTAIFLAAKAVVPQMKRQGGGSIIVTASTSGIRPRPGLSAYSASKGAAILLTKALAIELAPSNIRVNAICPVAANTPMLERFGFGATRDEAVQRFVASIPLGRLAEPEDIAQAAVYLASDEARAVTGITLEVDGGRDI
jgi:3-oxoacyl-[acyl-carrier protein] reductase